MQEICHQMMSMNGRTGGGGGGKWEREIAFSGTDYQGDTYYWRDPEGVVRNGESLERAIRDRKPEQVHFVSLRLFPYYFSSSSGTGPVIAHEVVFDIDVTSFPRYCSCTRKKDQKTACSVCWQFIEGSSFLLEYVLQEFYGIDASHLLWVLSGMKGYHCLVNDSRFLFMDRPQRALLFQQLSRASDKELIAFASSFLMPDAEFVSSLENLFEERSVVKRSLLDSPEFREACLEMVRVEYHLLYNALMSKWLNATNKSSLEKWRLLRQLEKGQFPPHQPLPSLIIILRCYYPRIDRGPLVEKRHPFKLPYSVHAKTRKIALPMRREDLLRDGLPEKTLSLEEVNIYYEKSGERHPLLTDSIAIFRDWLCYYNESSVL